jgi:uncharacterized RDD family membrane protein YckC
MTATDASRLRPAETAPAGARLVAFGIDLTLALAGAVAVRFYLNRPLPGGPLPAPLALLASPSTWLLALGLAALRDLPLGAGPGKWLLCLRVTNLQGGRLGTGRRLLRAPVSLLPLEWLAGERRGQVPWRVIAYSPGRAGLGLRLCIGALAAGWILVWSAAGLRPSIGRADATLLVERTLGRDPELARRLGAPMEFEIESVAARSRTRQERGRGEFTLRVHGPLGRQEMVVRALKVEGHWAIDEVVDIRETRLAGGSRPDTTAAR